MEKWVIKREDGSAFVWSFVTNRYFWGVEENSQDYDSYFDLHVAEAMLSEHPRLRGKDGILLGRVDVDYVKHEQRSKLRLTLRGMINSGYCVHVSRISGNHFWSSLSGVDGYEEYFTKEGASELVRTLGKKLLDRITEEFFRKCGVESLDELTEAEKNFVLIDENNNIVEEFFVKSSSKEEPKVKEKKFNIYSPCEQLVLNLGVKTGNIFWSSATETENHKTEFTELEIKMLLGRLKHLFEIIEVEEG